MRAFWYNILLAQILASFFLNHVLETIIKERQL